MGAQLFIVGARPVVQSVITCGPPIRMKHASSVTFLTLITIGLTLGQIHFTPDWGNNGKRSLDGQFVDDGSYSNTYSTTSCLEQTDLKFLLEIAKLLTREAKRLSSCLKECPTL
ncbi:unnamed protein product [Lymnaea stagnalis]|uniref:Uncharacterized protein n=1 Tax=Lymnaea stagnalis TaxID=6523 RepID=A0AAV2HEP7_LYMST